MAQVELRLDAREHPNFGAACARLAVYLAQFIAVKEQGSIEWRIQRALYWEEQAGSAKSKPWLAVGGSELGVLLGVDRKFIKDPLDLIDKKATFLTEGQDPPSDAPPTMTAWGHILEPAEAHYVELLFGTQHFGLEASVVHRRVKNFRYSPDGFVILRNAADDLIFAVLELKNPFGRVVKGDKVPDHYMPQVKSGMDMFSELVTHGLFVEANYYVQSLADYGQPRYNPRISGTYKSSSVNGKTGRERFDGITCIDACLIGFYENPKGTSNGAEIVNLLKQQMVTKGAYNAQYDVFDLGCSEMTTFELVMRLHAAKHLVTAESSYVVGEETPLGAAIGELRAVGALVFVMPVGLFKLAWYLHQGDPYYVESHRGTIERFVSRLEAEVEKRGGLHPMFSGGAPPQAAEKPITITKPNVVEYDE